MINKTLETSAMFSSVQNIVKLPQRNPNFFKLHFSDFNFANNELFPRYFVINFVNDVSNIVAKIQF